jgi:hypothetical protein
MRKRDMNTIELFAEAVGIVAALVYVGLQIYYGVSYGLGVGAVAGNVVAMILVYLGLSLLECYPERVNGLTVERCKGDIRRYTIRMIRISKLIFTGSLLLTSICDAMGHELNAGYSILVVIAIVLTAVYYEYKIIRILRKL